MIVNEKKIIDLSRECMERVSPLLVSMVEGSSIVDWKQKNFMYDLPLKWQCSFAIYDNDTVAGFCVSSKKADDNYYIHLLFVDDLQRGKGIGSKMIKEALRRAAYLELPAVALRCPSYNEAAKSFYLREGFYEEGFVCDDTSGPCGDYFMRLAVDN